MATRKKHLINVHTSTGTTAPTGASLYLGEIAVQHTPDEPGLWIKMGTSESSDEYEKFIGETKITSMLSEARILGSAYTYTGLPQVNSATTLEAAYSALTKEVVDGSLVVASALNDLNGRVIEVSGNTPDMTNYYDKGEVEHIISVSGGTDVSPLSGAVESLSAAVVSNKAETDKIAVTAVTVTGEGNAVTAATYAGSALTLAMGDVGGDIDMILGSGYTYSGLPYVTSATSLADAYSALTREMIDDEKVVSEALNDLNGRVGAVSADTMSVMAHTADTGAHVTAAQKTAWTNGANSGASAYTMAQNLSASVIANRDAISALTGSLGELSGAMMSKEYVIAQAFNDLDLRVKELSGSSGSGTLTGVSAGGTEVPVTGDVAAIPSASSSVFGVVKTGDFLTSTNGTIKVATGTTSSTVARGDHAHSGYAATTDLNALSAATTAHTADTTAHVTAAQKTNWTNSGTSGANAYVGFIAHSANTQIHVTAAEKTAWDAKADGADLAGFFDGVEYDSANKVINFKHGATVKGTVDATAFIKDGMVDNVVIETPTGGTYAGQACLVVTFNSVSGKQPIYIPLTQIFDPSNYYNKTTADSTFVKQVSGKGLSTNDYTTTEKNKLAGIAAGAEVNVNADWNATSGDAQILNKPTIPSAPGTLTTTATTAQSTATNEALSGNIQLHKVAKTGSYNDLNNKPSIPTVPTNVSSFSNDAGYVTTAQTKTQIESYGYTTNVGTVTGIKMNGASKGTSGVVDLGTVLTGYTETDPTVPAWAKAASKPSYTASEVGALPTGTTLDNIGDGTTRKLSNYSLTSHTHSQYATQANFTAHTADTTVHVTSTEKNTWNGKQDAISDLATIRSNASAGAAKVSNVQSDWNATSGLAQILNKPSIPQGTVTSVGITNGGGISVAGSPITTSGNITITADGSAIINNLGEGASPAERGDYIVAQYAGGGTTTTSYHRRKLSNIFAALNSSDITNALGYTPYNATNPNGYTSNQGTVTGIKMNGASKGTSGVVDLGTVITGETDPTVPAWAKAASKPSYTASEVGAASQANFTAHTASTTVHVTSTEKNTWNGKQDAISDLATIRSNAAAGAAKVSNVQSDWNATSGLAQILHKPTIPTVNNGTLTIQQNGTTVGTFTANQAGNTTANITVNGLPNVTSSDDNKILLVQNGAWTVASPTMIYTGSGTPASTLGNEGDIYLQI